MNEATVEHPHQSSPARFRGASSESNTARCAALLGMVVVLTSCNNDARVEVDYQHDQVVPRAQTTVTLEDGSHRYVVSGEALVGSGLRPSYSTLSQGTLRVGVVMADATGSIAAGQLSLPLSADNGYGISVAIDSVNPRKYCFGCVGSATFPLRSGVGRSTRDSMWITWGSGSISDPVTY